MRGDGYAFKKVVGKERFDVAIPPVVARIFSGDSTSPLTRDGHGCPKLNAQRLCTDAKPLGVHMARVMVRGEG